MTALPSEDKILERIDKHFSNARPGMALGRGDDCAIFEVSGQVCASTDLLVDDIHFRRSYFEPEEIGHKALAVNVSDLAAMGARPAAFQMALGLPSDISLEWLDRLLAGMAAYARMTGATLSGGDISRAPVLLIAITVFGFRQDGCNLLARGGSMPGDAIFVVGSLGLARAGLWQMDAHGRAAIENWPKSCAALLRPRAQTSAGLMLARAGFNARPPALMDISDGLCRDLPRLLGQRPGQRNLGAELDLPAALLEAEVEAHARENGLDPWLETYLGGDDYALLGSCAPDMLGALHAAIPGFCRIGEVTTHGRIFLRGRDVTSLNGFDHFSQTRQS